MCVVGVCGCVWLVCVCVLFVCVSVVCVCGCVVCGVCVVGVVCCGVCMKFKFISDFEIFNSNVNTQTKIQTLQNQMRINI